MYMVPSAYIREPTGSCT